jgi:NNP family nitrate/nitrite transporter-like MFS transporter
MGGGVTYVVMVALYAKLHETMSQHVAWRVAFAVVPVPILLFVAALTLIFGTGTSPRSLCFRSSRGR